MGLYQTDGIVLANRDMGEADRVVTMLCRDQGKVEAVARGARRPRNRLVGLTLPFNVLHMSIFTGRGLDELSQAEGIRIFHVLRSDLFLLAYASYLVELTREFLPDREPNDAVFHLLLQSLEGLEDRHAPEDVTRYFELRLLDLAGFRPSLEGCLHCGRPPDEVTAFSPAEGGFFCRACTVAGGDYLALSRVAIAAMLRGLGGEEGFLAPLPAAERQALKRVLRTFIEARLDKELHALTFLTGLLAEEQAE